MKTVLASGTQSQGQGTALYLLTVFGCFPAAAASDSAALFEPVTYHMLIM